MGEIKLVLGIVKSILGEVAGLQQKEIAVITPWREQVWKLRKGLRAAGFSGVDVGNVEVSLSSMLSTHLYRDVPYPT